MSFFFEQSGYCAKWTLKNPSSNPADEAVLLGKRVWQSLNSLTDAVFISITSVGGMKASLLCSAKLDEELDERTVAVPEGCVHSYPEIFSLPVPTDLFILSSIPTTLSDVSVVALSDQGYLVANDDPTFLVQQLFRDGRILRRGETISLSIDNPESSSPLVYRLELLEPAHQGCARAGVTRIVLLSSTTLSVMPFREVDELDQDILEIDEGFLANSFLNTRLEQPPQVRHGRLDDTIASPDPSAMRYGIRYLDGPCSIAEDHWTLYVRTVELGRIGILSGDWAVAGSKPTSCRLVRIEANDHVVGSPGCVAGSPILLHNLGGDQHSKDSFLYLSPSPFGSFAPAIPVARCITVARVASPISTSRQFQASFVNALKAHFGLGRKLVKHSDLFAVMFDTDLSRWPLDEESRDTESEHPWSRHPACYRRQNEVAFFKITNIEYDLMSRSQSSRQDVYTGSTLGELGCWVDSTVTRIVQTGVDHSRVPDIISYAQLDTPISVSQSQNVGPGNAFATLLALASAALSQKAADYNLDLCFLLQGGRSVGKFTVASLVVQRLGMHLYELDCYDILSEIDAKTEATLRVRFEQALSVTPCMLVLRHLEALSQTSQASEANKEPSIVSVLKEELHKLQSSWQIAGYPLIVVGTTSDERRVPPGLLNCFKQVITFEAPNERERQEVLGSLLQRGHLISRDVSLQHVATQTAALLAGDLQDLVSRTQTARLARVGDGLERNQYSLVPLTASDFELALGKARTAYSESIGAPKIPAVSWDDVGGLAHVKSDILDTIQLPLDHPELFADGLKKRSGILLYGPPGTGKTLLAKAVATSCSLNFFSVKGPELLNMYIGESEANVRQVFQRARDAKPCVIFFDELDSVAPKRGNHGDSGGVMDRIVSQLLAELDGMSAGQAGTDVFVIGATNRPDLLDPALLRPGRFDRMLYLGVSDSHEAQLNILEALTRKFRLEPGLDLRSIADQCPFNYTGADFYALCSDAMLNAMSRKAEAVEQKIGKYLSVDFRAGKNLTCFPAILNAQPPPYQHPHPMTPQYYLAELATPEDVTVYVSSEDFERALRALVPSVSQTEMEHYAQVQQRFSQQQEL